MQHQEVGSVGAAAGFAAVAQSVSAAVPVTAGGAMATSLADYKLIRRNGAVVAFEPGKIAVAMTKAFLAVRGGQGAASAAVREQVERLTASVVGALVRRQPAGGTVHIEEVQDQVELALMRDGAHDVARSYVLYRERRAQERAAKAREQVQPAALQLCMIENGSRVPLDLARLRALVDSACVGLGEQVSAAAIVEETVKNLREVAPTIFFNVPKGFEMLLPYLRAEPALREKLFSRLQCFFYAGAALPPHVTAEYEKLALEAKVK